MKRDVLLPLRRFHGWLHNTAIRQKMKKEYLDRYKQKLRANPQTVFLLMTPAHTNYGDHAIAMAEIQLLSKLGIDYLEITGEELFELERYNALGFMNGYPIVMQGGGYLGTLWYAAEKNLRAIISSNPNSVITLFPNTIYYEDTSWGEEEFKKSVEIYNRHLNLHIFARERHSFQTMSECYKNVALVPDIVLSLEHSVRSHERKGCLLCMRQDCEKTITDDKLEVIRQSAVSLFGSSVGNTDMIASNRISVNCRESAITEKLEQFSHAELVITDRLHGMIFCAITGTPCIVVNSKSPKVRGCYEWIKHLDYIKFTDDVSQIPELYSQIPAGEHHYDNTAFRHYFDDLSNAILKAVASVRR